MNKRYRKAITPIMPACRIPIQSGARLRITSCRQACPGCRTSKGHKWQELYTADGVVIHRLKGVYITYCSSLERYFLLDEKEESIVRKSK